MSGTHLFYNGVLMRDCELLDFQQVVEYDAESQTDPLYSRVRITVASMLISLHSTDAEDDPPLKLSDTADFLDGQHLSTIAIRSVDGESVVDRVQFIQQRLQVPRKDFWFALNATTNKPLSENHPNDHTPAADATQNDSYRVVLAATGIDDFADVDQEVGSATKGGRVVSGLLSGPRLSTDILREDVVDMNNGPKPSNISIARIDGGRAIRVHFTIEVCRFLCGENESDPEDSEGNPTIHPVRDAQRVKGVISNRWSIRESLDDKWQSTVAIEGTLTVSDQRYKPDAMRLMTSCALFPYAQLKNREFFYAASGLTLKYRYTMQEVGHAPPPHIVDWEGHYVEKTGLGGLSLGSLSLRLRGTNTPPANMTAKEYKRYLVTNLFAIALSRIPATDKFKALPGTNPKNMTVKDMTVSENMKEPEVSLNLIVEHSSPDVFEAFSLRLKNMGEPLPFPNYDARWWPIPPAYAWDVDSMATDATRGNLGSAFDGYYQSPCSQWHGKPSGLTLDRDAVVDRDGYQSFLYEDDTPAVTDLLPPPNPLNHAWSDEQLSEGFTYIKFRAESRFRHSPGQLALPLSKPRIVDEGQSGQYTETVAVIPVHAGVQERVFHMTATREGKPPRVPEPKRVIFNTSVPYAAFKETLVDARLTSVVPEAASDGVTMQYSVSATWTYIRSKPIESSEDYLVPSDPRDKTTLANNALPFDELFTGNDIA